jgi:acyl carrier protein
VIIDLPSKAGSFGVPVGWMMEQTAQDGSASARSDNHDRIRSVLAEHGQLGMDARALDGTSDLYEAGMTSRASVSVMLALESEFGIEFPDSMLRRDVFESIEAIGAAVQELTGKR